MMYMAISYIFQPVFSQQFLSYV